MGEERVNCVYCGKLIEKRSREHIIQNAIGGLYESSDICCPKCNEYISKYIDAPFTKTFNPIVSRIENFAKTNNRRSQPTCTGKALYNNEIYDVYIKNGKVVGCPKLSKEIKGDVGKLKFKILAYDFAIENMSFKNGIRKIAFNFAIDKGIELDILKHGLSVQEHDGIIEDISFNYDVIPFVSLNPMDKFIELDTEMELYHNLILFSQGEYLWCYVDLFNTFQYYVLLSEAWDENKPVCETYLQLLQKLDRTVPELHIRRQKHILIYARYYNVEPCLDLEEFQKRVEQAISKESLKKDMSDILSSKLGVRYLQAEKLKEMPLKARDFRLKSLLLYFDEEDKLKDSTFRQVTYTGVDMDVVSYPLLISLLLKNKRLDVRRYTYAKFNRLNTFLADIDNIDGSILGQ